MAKSLLRTDKDIAALYERHVNTVYRVCFAYMKNHADTEDMVQAAFVKLINRKISFESEEHEKAWLIRTASNICIDSLRSPWRRRESLEDHTWRTGEEMPDTDEVFQAVMDLPHKYKSVVYMHYYEGYTSVEIARMLKKPPSTIRNYLHEARKLLKTRLEDRNG